MTGVNLEIDPDIWESSTRSFVVRIWLEEAPRAPQGAAPDTAADAGDAPAGDVTWRGHITYVATGEKRYFGTLAELTGSFIPHLQALGVRVEDEIPCSPGCQEQGDCALVRWAR